MVNLARQEIHKMEPLCVHEVKLARFDAAYLSVHTKGKGGPLLLAILHDDYQNHGVHVYWSRKCKFPCEEDSEGRLSHRKTHRGVFVIAQAGDTIQSEYMYIAVYCHAHGARVRLATSFGNREQLIGLIPA